MSPWMICSPWEGRIRKMIRNPSHGLSRGPRQRSDQWRQQTPRKVSRQIFQTLFPSWPQEEVPIGSVNQRHSCAHLGFCRSRCAVDLCLRVKRWRGDRPSEDDIRQIPNQRLGNCARQDEKPDRARCASGTNASSPRKARIRRMLPAFSMKRYDLGFARRFATYKRPNLLLHDPEGRLVPLALQSTMPCSVNPRRKSSSSGSSWTELSGNEGFHQAPRGSGTRGLPQRLRHDAGPGVVQGIDLWINTPRRPWEACGTSGMKVLVNGG